MPLVAAPPLLSLQGVARSHTAGLPGCMARVRVLRRASLDVHAGERVALTGSAGAGKTTLLLCAAGLLRPHAGAVLWSGAAASRTGMDHVSFVPDAPVFQGYLSVGDVLALAAAREPYVERLARPVLRRLRLASRLQLRVAELGVRDLRRLALACALLHSPRLLLVDEAPACEDDPLLLSTITEHTRRGGAALLATRASGQLAQHATREVRLDDGVLREVARAPARVLPRESPAADGERLPLPRPPMVAEPHHRLAAHAPPAR